MFHTARRWFFLALFAAPPAAWAAGDMSSIPPLHTLTSEQPIVVCRQFPAEQIERLKAGDKQLVLVVEHYQPPRNASAGLYVTTPTAPAGVPRPRGSGSTSTSLQPTRSNASCCTRANMPAPSRPTASASVSASTAKPSSRAAARPASASISPIRRADCLRAADLARPVRPRSRAMQSAASRTAVQHADARQHAPESRPSLRSAHQYGWKLARN